MVAGLSGYMCGAPCWKRLPQTFDCLGSGTTLIVIGLPGFRCGDHCWIGIQQGPDVKP